MADSSPVYRHFRCEEMGSVTIAVADPTAFDESTHPDDWTPHLSDISTNREVADDLTRLAQACPGALVLDLRVIDGLLGDAPWLLLRLARQMEDAGKPLALCASPSLLETLRIIKIDRRISHITDDLSAAVAMVSSTE